MSQSLQSSIARTGGSVVLGLRTEFRDLASLQSYCIGNVDRSSFIATGCTKLCSIDKRPVLDVAIIAGEWEQFK